MTDHQSIASHFERELISANAEIERLQIHKRAQADDIMTLGQQVGKLEAEIKRQKNCYIKIIRESLDTGEYERSLGQTIVDRIRDLDQEDKG